MNIDQAIEILSEAAFGHAVTFGPDFYDADRLGLEALKAVKSSREYVYIMELEKLPGETIE